MSHTTGSKHSGRRPPRTDRVRAACAACTEVLEERQLFAAPTAQYVAITGAQNPAGNAYQFSVIYTPQGSPVTAGSIDIRDVVVTGPAGTTNATSAGATPNGNGSVTGTYTIPPPPAGFPGQYTVQLQAN